TASHPLSLHDALPISGKHVLCEIPLALSLADTDRLTALADQVDRRLMVCHTQRYWASSIAARRLVAGGDLRVHALFARFMFHRRSEEHTSELQSLRHL